MIVSRPIHKLYILWVMCGQFAQRDCISLCTNWLRGMNNVHGYVDCELAESINLHIEGEQSVNQAKWDKICVRCWDDVTLRIIKENHPHSACLHTLPNSEWRFIFPHLIVSIHSKPRWAEWSNSTCWYHIKLLINSGLLINTPCCGEDVVLHSTVILLFRRGGNFVCDNGGRWRSHPEASEGGSRW